MVEGNNSLVQPLPLGILTPNKAGVVYAKNNALIEMANNAISTNPLRQPWPQWNDYTGGLVVCENMDFKNNERAIEFMKYDSTETSKIVNCDFFESDNKCVNSRGITIWKTNGLKVENSRFFNLDKFGIYGIDFGAKIINGCSFNNIYDKGIESYETAPYSSVLEVGSSSSIPNYFTDIPIMIYSSSSAFGDGLQIVNNNFYNGGYGIAVSGQSNYLISENSFDKFRVGIQTENTSNYNNYISCNSFFNEFDSGILFAGTNGSPSVGCQFLQNLFQENPVDIRLVRAVNNTIGSVRGFIGSSIFPADNCFTPNIINIVAPISNTTTFNYYLNDNISCHDPNGSLTDGGTNNYYENYTSAIIESCIKVSEEFLSYNEVLNYLNNGGANDDENSELIYNSLKKLTHELYDQNKLNELKLLLEAEGSVHSKRTLYGIYLKKGLINKAEEYLNSIQIGNDDDQDFLEIQEINIKFHKLGIESITVEDSLKLELKNIKSNPSSGYAKGLLALFYEKSFQPNDYTQIDQNIVIDSKSNNFNDLIYPNPVTNIINLEINSDSNDESVIEIIGMNGSKTFYNKGLHKGINKLTFDISDYNSGLYILKFNSDNNVRVIKFIKL